MTPALSQAASAPEASLPRAPSRLRFAFCVLLFVYPLVLTLQYALAPLVGDWPLPLRTAALAPAMVVAMVWGVIPFIQTRMRRFL